MAEKPRFSDCPMYRLLRMGEIVEFNKRKAKGEPCDLVGTDLSRLDLRGLNADGLDIRNGYFRMCDLRGVDLSQANLEGASFAQAHVSGCYFPKGLSAAEIDLALEHGTRVRYST